MLPRFVVLEHDHPFLHWDFLLEHGDRAFTWRLLEKPECNRWLAAERINDHRPLYLNYEGPVSGNRGSVRRLFFGDHQACNSFAAAMSKSPGIAGQWQIPLVGVAPGTCAILRRFACQAGHVPGDDTPGDHRLGDGELMNSDVKIRDTQKPGNATAGQHEKFRSAIRSAGAELPISQIANAVTTSACQIIEQWRFTFSCRTA